MSEEVKTEFTGDATSLAAATQKAQEGLTGVLEATEKAASRLGQLNQVVELAAKAQAGLTAASAFLATGTAAVTAAVKAQTLAFLSSPLAPVAVAVLALGVAYASLAKGAEAATKRLEASGKAAAAAQASVEKLTALQTSVYDKEALALGKVTRADLDLRDALADVTAVYGPKIKAQQEAIAKAEKEGQTTEQMRVILGGLVEQQGKMLQATTRGIVLTEADRKAKLAKADADKAAAGAVDEAAEAEARWAKAVVEGTLYSLDRAMKASTERAEIEKANAEIIAVATEETAARQLEAEEALRVRRIEMAEEQAEQYAQGIEDRKELDQQYAESAAAVAQAGLQVASDIADAEYEKRADTIEKLEMRLEEGEETLTASQKEALEERIAANKKAALTAFNVAKAVAATQAAISTALAVVNALATPVPYPVAVGFAIAAGIAGAASTAAILMEEPPSFHAGGLLPDERSITALSGEGVVNRQGMAAIGGEGLNAINHGGNAPSGGVASFRVGRLEAKEIARTDIRSNGAIPQAIRSFVNRSSNGTGLSGRLAIR